MKFGTILLAILLIVAVFGTHRGVRRSRSAAERFFAIRMSAFSWVLGFTFLVALIFLPNKQRVLMLLPLFLVGATVVKLWRTGRERLRREHAARDRFIDAKRVN